MKMENGKKQHHQPPSSRLKRNILYIHVECSDQKKKRKILRPQLRRQREKSPEFSLSCWVFFFSFQLADAFALPRLLLSSHLREHARVELVASLRTGTRCPLPHALLHSMCRAKNASRLWIGKLLLFPVPSRAYCAPNGHGAHDTSLARQVIYIDRGRVRNQKISKWIVLGIYGRRARIVNVNEQILRPFHVRTFIRCTAERKHMCTQKTLYSLNYK